MKPGAWQLNLSPFPVVSFTSRYHYSLAAVTARKPTKSFIGSQPSQIYVPDMLGGLKRKMKGRLAVL